MSTTASEPVTGRKVPATAAILTLTGIGMIAIVFGVYTVFHKRPAAKAAAPKSQVASGGMEPTLELLRSGKSPEEMQSERSQQAWQQSLKIPADAQQSRQSAAKAPNSFEKRVPEERKAKDVALGGEGLLADVADATVAPLLGTGGTPTSAPGTLARSGTSGGDPSSAGIGSGIYLSLNRRQMIAAQQEKGADGKPAPNTAPSGDSSPGGAMQLLPVPEDVQPATQPARTVRGGQRMPVNVLPPYTIPIPCRFDMNFIAVGAGEDTRQRIVCTVEQDVWARNRLQLPKGAKIIGSTGGVRDLDLVDVSFDTIQFPDLTQVQIKAQAYQPYSPIAPGNYGMRGVVGEYEEPDVPKQVAPIFLAALQAAARSNLERLQAGAVNVVGQSGMNTVSVRTTDKDRLYAAAGGSMDKIVEMMMEKLRRYRPRVRVRAGSPVLVVLDDYVDLTKRSMMGFNDPLKEGSAGDAKTPSTPGAGEPATAPATPPEAAPPSANPLLPDRETVRKMLESASPEQKKLLKEMADAPKPS